jgi:hypothetical protein
MLDDLDAETLVVRVCPCEVAVGEQPAGVMAADELEFFPVAHDVSVPGSGTSALFSGEVGKGMKGTLPLCSLVWCGVPKAHDVVHADVDSVPSFGFQVFV